MKNRKAKIAAGATVVGLGALGGLALGTNPGVPASHPAAGRAAAIVTGSSGAPSAAVQPVAASGEARPPIVTRASGGVGAPLTDD